MKKSLLLSLVLAGLVAAWMLSGQFDGEAKSAATTAPQTTQAPPEPFKVLVESLSASDVTRQVIVQGQLESERAIDLRAETGGQVVELLVRKGERVSQGQVLLRLAEDDRPARIAGARAELAQQVLAYEGAARLAERQLQSETQLKLAEAAVAAARANLRVAELDLERTEISAPFDGVLERVDVELGSLVERGDPVVHLVDNSSLKAVGFVPQQSAGKIAVGQAVALRLLDGNFADATVEFISRVADSETRSFRVEARLDGDIARLSAGVSAEMVIDVGTENAHFVSPSILTLDTGGQVGVRTVDDDGLVGFYPVTLVRTQADGVWVAGLPGEVRVIVRGQSFVVNGQAVEAVDSL